MIIEAQEDRQRIFASFSDSVDFAGEVESKDTIADRRTAEQARCDCNRRPN